MIRPTHGDLLPARVPEVAVPRIVVGMQLLETPKGNNGSAKRRFHNVQPVPPDTMALSGIPYDDDNVFKKIIEGTIPSYKIFETEHALAFLDAFPMAKGHALLIPKAEGYASVIDMPPEVAAEVLKELPRLAKHVKDATGCDGVNIVQNNGASAGQMVFHVHFHVLPRWEGDGLVKLGKSGDMIAKEDALALLRAMGVQE